MLAVVAAALLASGLAAAPWEATGDPAVGVQLRRPAGWPVDALENDAIVVRSPAPLQGSVVVTGVRAPGASARDLVAGFAARLGARVLRESDTSTGHAALVQFADPASPEPDRTALVSVDGSGERGVLSIVTAPSQDFDAARPALLAISSSVELSAPKLDVSTIGRRPPLYEPSREPREQAFTIELPAEWTRTLSAGVVQGSRPYARASALGQSPDGAWAFVHYKPASFQEPVPGLTPESEAFRAYAPGALALERHLFPSVVASSPGEVADARIEARGGRQPLFEHPSGARLDGEEVRYSYRHRGVLTHGRAYAVTLLLPAAPSPNWYLFALFGWESPEGREPDARDAALHLVRTFSFDGRYAAQGDALWKLSRAAALRALAADTTGPRAPMPHRAAAGPVEMALAGFSELPADGSRPACPVRTGSSGIASDEPVPRAGREELDALR